MRKYILDHMKISEEDLKYDFLPPMQEIIEKPAHRAGEVIIIGFFAIMVIVFIWASVSKLDIVASTSGSVTVDCDVELVRAGAGGFVEKVNAAENDVVKPGDVLAELEAESDKMLLKQYEEQLAELEAKQKVYLLINEEAEMEALDALKEGASYGVQKIIEEERYYQEMDNKTYKEYEQQRKVEILGDIEQTENNLKSVKTSIQQLKERLDTKKLVARTGGKVVQMSVEKESEEVVAGQTVAYIVPEGGKYIMKSYVSNAYVADVEVGQQVNVKLEAYPYNKFGYINGTVSKVSEIATSMEGRGMFFQVEIELEEREDITYMIGMTGSCDIVIGQRTVLEYFMEPIRKGFEESLKER